jgi:hypothetical protein
MSVAGTILAKDKEYQARAMEAKSLSEPPWVCKNIWIFNGIFIK